MKSQYGAMLYEISGFVNEHTKNVIIRFHLAVYVQFGISIWGIATNTKLHELEIRLNNIVRSITWNKRFYHVTHLFKKLEFLKLNDMCKFELAKFMHKLFNDKLPQIFEVVL